MISTISTFATHATLGLGVKLYLGHDPVTRYDEIPNSPREILSENQIYSSA